VSLLDLVTECFYLNVLASIVKLTFGMKVHSQSTNIKHVTAGSSLWTYDLNVCAQFDLPGM